MADNGRSRPLPPVQVKGKPKAKKGNSHRQQQSQGSGSEESLTEVGVEQAPRMSQGRSLHGNSHSPSEVLEAPSENVDLNSTQMFTLNSSAKLLPDGSLDYSGKEAFDKLPLTPIMFRRKPDVPPLDLTPLRSSNDSALSSLNFQPYSGTVRSTDTYRPNERSHYQYLGSVAEGAGDVNIWATQQTWNVLCVLQIFEEGTKVKGMLTHLCWFHI